MLDCPQFDDIRAGYPISEEEEEEIHYVHTASKGI